MGTTTATPNFALTQVATNLRTIRKSVSLTQKELADKAGCCTATVINIEKSGRCRADTLKLIVAALKGAGASIC